MTAKPLTRARRHVWMALLLLTALLPFSALAENLPEASLTDLAGTTIERTLTRMSGDGYDYYTYVSNGFDAGRIAGMPVDLDSDGSDEYLLVTMGDDHSAMLSIWESGADGAWTKASEALLFNSEFTCSTEAHDVFLKNVEGSWLIFSENWYHEDCIADGASWNLLAYHYEGGELTLLSDMYIEGTDLSGELDSWCTDDYYLTYRPELQGYAGELRGYGFRISRVYWDQMICEQDPELDVLCRVYSRFQPSYAQISAFVSSWGEQLSGFYTTVVDCTAVSLRLPEDVYLSAEVAEDDTAAAVQASDSEYLIPDSDVRLLTEEELSQYDMATLALIRNEILARYGYPFQKQQYREYFEAKSWYVRDEGFSYGSLNSIEMENVELIKKLENQ